MPTFRGKADAVDSKDSVKEMQGYLDVLDRCLDEDQLLLVKLHPFVGNGLHLSGYQHIQKFPEGYDTYEVLNMCDVLITDYSSIYIDYLLTDKPMIFLPYDRQQYLDGRGMNFDYDDVTPGPKPETFNDFLDALSPKEDFWKSERTRVNRLFNEIQHPCAADICNKVLKMIR